MHKILVINGSPKKRSNTMKLVESFLEGIKDKDASIEIRKIDLVDKNIRSCTGCYSCWKKTPGTCVLEDDMEGLLKQYKDAEIVIWATPLYHFGITSIMKKFMERTLPELLPFIDDEGSETYRHPYRNLKVMENKKHILISNCGFPSKKNNYEGVYEQFDQLFGKNAWEKIICAEGELLSVTQLDNITGPYLELVRKAGQEYIETHHISKKLKSGLEKPLVAVSTFLEIADLSWDVEDLRKKEPERKSNALRLMKQMASVFNPKISPGLKAVLEMEFVDSQEKYQLVVEDNKCILLEEDFLEPTTKIKTGFKIWERISEGKLDPSHALVDKKYSVEGDLKFINLLFDGLFGSFVFHHEKKRFKPIAFVNTPFWFILTMIPWAVSFIMSGFNSVLSVVVPLLISGILCSIKKGAALNYFDKTTMLFFSFLTLLTVPWGTYYSGGMITVFTSFGLSLIWGVTLLRSIPLTADYTHYFYGRNALKNLLFLKTNRILTLVWALVFLVQGLFGMLLNSFGGNYFQSILPMLLYVPTLVFTFWFTKWYPAHCMKPEEEYNQYEDEEKEEKIETVIEEEPLIELDFGDITPELLKPKSVKKETVKKSEEKELEEKLKKEFEETLEEEVEPLELEGELQPEETAQIESIELEKGEALDEVEKKELEEEDEEKKESEMVVFKID